MPDLPGRPPPAGDGVEGPNEPGRVETPGGADGVGASRASDGVQHSGEGVGADAPGEAERSVVTSGPDGDGRGLLDVPEWVSEMRRLYVEPKTRAKLRQEGAIVPQKRKMGLPRVLGHRRSGAAPTEAAPDPTTPADVATAPPTPRSVAPPTPVPDVRPARLPEPRDPEPVVDESGEAYTPPGPMEEEKVATWLTSYLAATGHDADGSAAAVGARASEVVDAPAEGPGDATDPQLVGTADSDRAAGITDPAVIDGTPADGRASSEDVAASDGAVAPDGAVAAADLDAADGGVAHDGAAAPDDVDAAERATAPEDPALATDPDATVRPDGLEDADPPAAADGGRTPLHVPDLANHPEESAAPDPNLTSAAMVEPVEAAETQQRVSPSRSLAELAGLSEPKPEGPFPLLPAAAEPEPAVRSPEVAPEAVDAELRVHEVPATVAAPPPPGSTDAGVPPEAAGQPSAPDTPDAPDEQPAPVGPIAPVPGRPSTVPAVTLSWREAESFDIGLPGAEDSEASIVVEAPSQMVAESRRRRRVLEADVDDSDAPQENEPTVDPPAEDETVATRASSRAASGSRVGKPLWAIIACVALLLLAVLAWYFLLRDEGGGSAARAASSPLIVAASPNRSG